MDGKTRKEYQLQAIALACTIIGALTRLIYIIRYPVQPRDSYGYELLINEWENLGAIRTYSVFTPLSIWMMKIPHHFFGYDVIKGGVIVNFVLGILIIFFATILANEIFENKTVAFFVGLIVATHPVFIQSSCVFLRENTYLFFSLLLTMNLVAYCKKHSDANLLSAGFFGALALLCRIEGIEVLVIVFLLFFFLCLFRKISVKKAIKRYLIFVFAFLATFLSIYYLLGVEFRDLNKIGTKLDFEKDFNI